MLLRRALIKNPTLTGKILFVTVWPGAIFYAIYKGFSENWPILILPAFFTLVAVLDNWSSNRKKPCKTCGRDSLDIVYLNDKGERYCRMHAMERFSKEFLCFTEKMVVFEPELERGGCGGKYPYFPLQQLETIFEFPKGTKDHMASILQKVEGECVKCREKPARVAYFRKGKLEWSDYAPLIEKVNEDPDLLCLGCALNEITLPLQQNPQAFNSNGLYLPYKESGVFVNTMM